MNRATDGAALVSPPKHLNEGCVFCGGPLVSQYWMVDYPRGAHEHCIDWTKEKFPFERYVAVLGLLGRRSTGAARAALLRLRDRMVAIVDGWPADAIARLAETRKIVAEAREHVRGLDHRDRMRL